MEVASFLIQADPTVMDNIDGDAALRFIANTQNLDQRLIRTEEQVEEIRAQRQAAIEAAQQQEQENQTVDNQSKLGSTVAKLQPTG